MGNANAFCKICEKPTWHRRRKSGVPFYVSILSLGLLRTKYYKCEVCEYRSRNPRLILEDEPKFGSAEQSEIASIESDSEEPSSTPIETGVHSAL